MKVEKLVEIIGSDFYTGVPDSQLKALCNYLMNTYGIDQKHHLIRVYLIDHLGYQPVRVITTPFINCFNGFCAVKIKSCYF